MTDQPSSLNKRCWSCKWFSQLEPGEGGPSANQMGGHCWRYPPVPSFQVAFDGTGAAVYENLRPYVGHNDGCGEHTEQRR